MPKYNVVLDTNIYRKSPSRADLHFQALERLCRANIVQLHLPYIVEKEFQTQQIDLHKKELETALSAINSMLRKNLPQDQTTRIEAIRTELDALKPIILSGVESDFKNWVASVGAQRHHITEELALAALESYFNGSPPLKQPKNRDDIPDAFIFQTIRTLSAEAIPLVVVAEDGKVALASEALTNVTVHRCLSDLIESTHIQTDILHLDVFDNFKVIANKVEKYEQETKVLSDYICHHGGDEIIWKEIHSRSIPDDNNKATISTYSSPENIKFYFVLFHYFGSGEFGLPFSFTTTVYADYYIYKPDYYCLDEKNAPNVFDHNEHYFRAEAKFEVNVSGLMKLSISPTALNNISAESLENGLTFGIDSIYTIEIVE